VNSYPYEAGIEKLLSGSNWVFGIGELDAEIERDGNKVL
jgi:hypothetical protein